MEQKKKTQPVAMPPVHLEVIIPVYNEADNIQPLVERLVAALRPTRRRFLLTMVDDHSTDDTVKIARRLQRRYPLQILTKQGQRGKAFSILEAGQRSRAEFLAMIDADLQYPPEALVPLLALARADGVAVARRQSYQDSQLRHLLSRSFQWFFGRVLHGLDCDVQSGLKVFRREVMATLQPSDVTPWTLDIPLLTTAKQLGYRIAQLDITFQKRAAGRSKIQFLSSIREIGGHAVQYKFRPVRPHLIPPPEPSSMVGAGVIHHGRRFITHTTLHPEHSALHVLSRPQQWGIVFLVTTIIAALVWQPLPTAIVLVGILSTVYFLDVIFNLYLILRSLQQPPEIEISTTALAELKSRHLPIYTILCPLYREAHVIPQFLAAINRLDWPKQKLDVLLLLEEDDQESIAAARAMKLPRYVRVVVVPHSLPKTKPKACNYGLHMAKGEYVVIYDAEDEPEPAQLRKSYLAFQKVGPEIKCLQAKLNYYNPHQNWLTRLFTAEYSLWFDVILTGLQSIQTSIPLGGTSNHFRTADLRTLQGWDPFNVTEDCDLGVRLFNQGYKTAIINSTTLEEANSDVKNWIRQRSRWIKGYMQTYLLHMRHPRQLIRQQGIHAFLFQLTVGGKISFILINPLLWLLTLAYFLLYAQVGLAIEALYPSVIFYMAVSSLLFGNFMFIYYYMIGCAKREHWSLMKWVFLIPIYWLMVSLAGLVALYELIVRPHYWQKTIHGLHLSQKASAIVKESVVELAAQSQVQPLLDRQKPFLPTNQLFRQMEGLHQRIKDLPLRKTLSVLTQQPYAHGVIFLAATLVANLLNLLTNVYLGSQLALDHFGVFSLVVSLLYLVSIPINAFGQTVTYKASYLFGKHQTHTLFHFWSYMRRRAMAVAFLLTAAWLLLTPWLPGIFKLESMVPFVTFGAVILMAMVASVDVSYLTAQLAFRSVAVIMLIQPLVRLITAVFFVQYIPFASYLAVMAGLAAALLTGWWHARHRSDEFSAKYQFHLPRRFFVAALIAGLAGVAFFSLDILLVAYLLSAADLGRYSLLAVFGKTIFFIGNLSASFLAPLVARAEGAGRNSKQIFQVTFLSVAVMTLLAYFLFAVGPYLFGHHFLGSRFTSVRELLPLYGFGISAFTLAQVVISYHLLKKQYLFPSLALGLTLLQAGLIFGWGRTLEQLVLMMSFFGMAYFFIFTVLHWWYHRLTIPLRNWLDFLELLTTKIIRPTQPDPAKLSVLILNWRDLNHVWAGGSEVMIHQLARQLVSNGHTVTVFCGNDGQSKRSEVVDGVQVIRRGGFYTVYFWAAIYYLVKFRKDVDVIIDTENGIPFFSPLFSRKPIFLLIHHVHQEFFRQYLRFPVSWVTGFLEGELMPWLYRHCHILTISESSKQAILGLGLGAPDSITVINPGIEPEKYRTTAKTRYPSLCYIGRLKPYKQVDIAIRAFHQLLPRYPQAKFVIAGSGESDRQLWALVKELDLENNVEFRGKVSEAEKAQLFGQSWLAVQPSMVEGWGITVIEANACGTPVVAARVSGLKDSTLDGNTGLLVESGNLDELAAAITQLWTNAPRRRQMSRNALRWATHFSWAQSAAVLEHLLKASTQPRARRQAYLPTHAFP